MSEPTKTTTDEQKRVVTNPKYKRVHVIINPAAGQDRPILKTLNTVFHDLNIDWDAYITKQAGDAKRFAQQAVEEGADAVAIYGGDGTVLEVASGLVGSDVPFVILPGGTANVLSVELGIPRELVDALSLLGSETAIVRPLDMGKMGEQMFFHFGIGLEAEMAKTADREAKDRSGLMAYIMAGLKNLRNPATSRYRLTLDDQVVETEGVNCMITNFGSIGVAGLSMSHDIDFSDGLLDVLVIRQIDAKSVLSAAADAISSGDIAAPLDQWQVREVKIEVDPPQSMMIDGEVVDINPIHARIVPHAVHVIVPAETKEKTEST